MAESAENNQENIIEQAVQRFVDAQLQGHNPDVNEFVKEYPGLEHKIKRRIQNLQEIDGLLASLLKADDSDFRDLSEEHNLVGQKLGDFEILKLIGRGGMGAVFLARQISLDREVALKIISDISGTHGKSLERFKREAIVLAKISHPNIVPIYEVGQQGPYSYFAMEYIKGVSLDKILGSIRNAKAGDKASDIMHKCLEAQTVIGDDKQQDSKDITKAEIDTDYIINISKIIINIASALDYAHQKGILHRDIKPSNILIASDGIPKLVDFGLAKAETQQTITITGEFFGTPNYVSPEQIRKPETVDCRSDVFSLAATYYECLTLHPPFGGDTVNETLTQVISREAVSPKKYCPRLSTDFSIVLLHALEKLPEDRYQTAADFVADIRNILEFKPITAKRPSITRRTYNTLRRNPLIVALGLAIVIVTTLSFLVYSEYRSKIRAGMLAKIQILIEDADILLCQAALNTVPWPAVGNECIAERAYEKYNNVLQIDNNNWWALLNRGISSLVLGEKVESALVDFKKVEKIKPGFSAIPYLKSKVLEQLGKEELRDITLDNIETMNPREAYILGLLALQQANPPENEKEALALFSVCVEKDHSFFPALIAKAFVPGVAGEDKLEESQTLGSLKPDVAVVHLLIGNKLMLLKDQPKESVSEFKRALELQPWNPQCHISLALAYESLGENENALIHLLKAYSLDDTCVTSYHLAIYYRLREENYEKCLHYCEIGLSRKNNLLYKKLILDEKCFALEEVGTPQQLEESNNQKETCMRAFLVAPGGKDDIFSHVDFMRFLCNTNRRSKAQKFYAEISLKKPQFKFGLGRALAEVYESDGNKSEAISLYQSLYEEIKLRGINKQGYDCIDRLMIINNLSNLKFSCGDSAHNITRLWTDLLKRFPHESDLWEYYGWFLSSWPQDYENAAEAFRQASRYTDNPEERFKLNSNLSTALMRAGKFEDAEKEFLALVQRLDKMSIYEPEDRWKFLNRSDMASKETAKSIYLGLSDTYLAKKEVANALNILEKGLERLPKCFELQRKMALIYTSQKDRENAIKAYSKYFTILPSKPTVWENLDFLNIPDAVIAFTDLLVGENQFDQAREFVLKERESKRESPPPISVYTALSYETSLYIAEAKIYLAANNFEKAIELMNEAIEIQPQIYITWDVLERAYLSRGMHNEAKKSAQRAIKLNPTMSFGYQWLSNICWTLGEKEEAIKTLKAYLSLNPTDVTAQKTIGALFIRLGNYEEAIESCHQVVLLDPKNVVAYADLAFLYAEIGDFEKAIEYQKKTIEMADDQSKKEYEKRLESYKAHKPWRK